MEGTGINFFLPCISLQRLFAQHSGCIGFDLSRHNVNGFETALINVRSPIERLVQIKHDPKSGCRYTFRVFSAAWLYLAGNLRYFRAYSPRGTNEVHVGVAASLAEMMLS